MHRVLLVVAIVGCGAPTGNKQTRAAPVSAAPVLQVEAGNGLLVMTEEGSELSRSPLPADVKTRKVTAKSQPVVVDERTVAYLEFVRKKIKATHCDLVVDDGKQRRTLLEDRFIHEIAPSPDGKRLAVAHGVKISVLDVASGSEVVSWDTESIEPRLYSHAGRHLSWRPDGKAIACRIEFLGGRFARPGEEFAAIFGDYQVFVLRLGGEASWFNLCNRDVYGLRWVASGS